MRKIYLVFRLVFITASSVVCLGQLVADGNSIASGSSQIALASSSMQETGQGIVHKGINQTRLAVHSSGGKEESLPSSVRSWDRRQQ